MSVKPNTILVGLLIAGLALATATFAAVLTGGKVSVFGVEVEIVGVKSIVDIVSKDKVKEIKRRDDEKVGRLEYSLAIGEKEKSQAQSPEATLKRFAGYESYFPITILLSKKTGQDWKYGEVKRMSYKSKELFNQRVDSDVGAGVTIEQLFARLQDWTDRENYLNFVQDQSRISVDYREKKGEIFAKIPIKINANHPNYSYRNKIFVPIIVVVAGEEKSEEGFQEFSILLFLDISKLPSEIFNRSIE